MNFEIFNKQEADEIKTLFTNVFAESEGQEEGNQVGELAYQLQLTTKPEDFYGFVARNNEKITGCIFFTRLSFDQPIEAFILSPVAVTSDCQGQGVGQKLIRFGIEHLKKNNVELLFTYGDPNYYSKVGFKPISEKVVKAPQPLTYPEGWLAQSLHDEMLTKSLGQAQCVAALNRPGYW